MASATRRGNGQTPAWARKIFSRATGNSWRRNSSLVRISFSVIGKKSDALHHGPIIIHPEVDDVIGNERSDGTIDNPVQDASEHLQCAETFLFIIIVQPHEGLVEFAADFGGAVEIAEHLREIMN